MKRFSGFLFSELCPELCPGISIYSIAEKKVRKLKTIEAKNLVLKLNLNPI